MISLVVEQHDHVYDGKAQAQMIAHDMAEHGHPRQRPFAAKVTTVYAVCRVSPEDL